MLSPGEGPKPKWGTLVADRVNAQHHQHMFCARLDLAVDDEEGGKGVQVSEVSQYLCRLHMVHIVLALATTVVQTAADEPMA